MSQLRPVFIDFPVQLVAPSFTQLSHQIDKPLIDGSGGWVKASPQSFSPH